MPCDGQIFLGYIILKSRKFEAIQIHQLVNRHPGCGHQSAFDWTPATVFVRASPANGHFGSVDMVLSFGRSKFIAPP